MLVLNAAFLWTYSLSCHSCRHIVGGRLKHFSRHPVRFKLWGLRVQAERQAHADRLGEPGLRGPDRPLCPPGGERLGTRPEVFLNARRRNIRAPFLRRRRDRRRRRRLAGRRGRPRGGRPHRPHLPQPPRQGPHGHGRRRHRRRPGQPVARGQLAGPFPRHDARRQAPQPLAHGRAARQGSTRARLRARAVGSACSTGRRAGKISQRDFGGHRYARLAHVGRPYRAWR